MPTHRVHNNINDKMPVGPLQAVENERSLLGYMILAGDCPNEQFNQIMSLIPASTLGSPGVRSSNGQYPPENIPLFFDESHRVIFRAIQDTYTTHGVTTLNLVAQKLRESGQLDLAGGEAYLASLEDDTWHPSEIPGLIGNIVAKWRARFQLAILAEIQRQTMSGGVTAGLYEQLYELQSEEVQTAGRQGLSMLNLNELFALEIPENDNLLDDRLLFKGSSMALLGQGGLGKSRLLLNLAVCAILGHSWCGFETHMQGLTWVIFQTENSARRLRFDLGCMLRRCSPEEHAEVNAHLHILVPLSEQDRDVNLRPDIVRRLAHEVKTLKGDIVVFDPLGAFFSGENLNDSPQMRTFFTAAMAVVKAHSSEAAGIFLHHARAGKVSIAGAIGYDKAAFGLGSKTLHSCVRGAINVVPGDEQDTDVLILSCGKNNDGKQFETFAVRLIPETMGYEVDPTFSLDNWKESISDKPQRNRRGRKALGGPEDVVKALKGQVGGLGWGKLQEAIEIAVKCEKSRAGELIKEGMTKKLITKIGRLYMVASEESVKSENSGGFNGHPDCP